MTPRYTWTPASEPPDSVRWVLSWHNESPFCEEGPRLNCYFREHWLSGRGSITHWKDVDPPSEGGAQP